MIYHISSLGFVMIFAQKAKISPKPYQLFFFTMD